MPHSFRHRAILVLSIVAAWRGLAELVLRHRALGRGGELALRVEARRAARIDGALARTGLRAWARVPVRVPVPVVGSTHAAVHVGVTRGADVDDVGLLELAMRRAADRRALVTPVDDRSVAHATDWGSMLGDERVVERAWRVLAALGVAPLLAMLAGVALTFFPLVRPLSDAAPWLAVAGLALVAAGALGARWMARRAGDDDPGSRSDRVA